MSVDVNGPWLVAFCLAFVRAVAWLSTAPPFNNRASVPALVRVGLGAGLGLLAVPAVLAAGVPQGTGGLVGAIVVQVVTGVALGLVVRVLVATFSAAGGFVDQFGAINPPPALDPLSDNSEPIFGALFEQVAIVLLFVSNGAMLLVHGFERSFGAGGLTLASTATLSNVFANDLATFFTAALQIAAPIIAVLFATQIGLALVAKAAPQMNVWVLGFPIQATLSLILVAVCVRVFPGYLDHLLGHALHDMAVLLRGR